MHVVFKRPNLPEDQGLTIGIHKVHTYRRKDQHGYGTGSVRIIFSLGEPDDEPKEVAVVTLHEPSPNLGHPVRLEMGDLKEQFESFRIEA